jgi:hypothetical protein
VKVPTFFGSGYRVAIPTFNKLAEGGIGPGQIRSLFYRFLNKIGGNRWKPADLEKSDPVKSVGFHRISQKHFILGFHIGCHT